MNQDIRVIIGSETDIIVAREQARRIGKEVGFPGADLTRIATGISEVARNIVAYAQTGEILIHTIDRDNKLGIEIRAEDKGPGIRDISLAMSYGYSTGMGRGLGLPGVRRLMDEFEVVSTSGSGTTVTMRKWLRRSE